MSKIELDIQKNSAKQDLGCAFPYPKLKELGFELEISGDEGYVFRTYTLRIQYGLLIDVTTTVNEKHEIENEYVELGVGEGSSFGIKFNPTNWIKLDHIKTLPHLINLINTLKPQ